jgi:hypothetical protein
MFRKDEASRVRHEFWTTFGRYMSPIPSAEDLKINWVNYHTRVKDLYFRMDVGKRSASVSISMEQRDLSIQEQYFKKFQAFKSLLHAALNEEWTWELHTRVDDKVISRIYKELSDVSVFNKEQWPDLISFFKPRIIALDAFWADAKYSFEGE